MPEQRGYVPPDSESRPATVTTETSEIVFGPDVYLALFDNPADILDSLPEIHRGYFVTLRQEIIDFTQGRGIPRDALTKPDALREAASELSAPDLTQLANILERFEYLLKNREPMKEDYTEALEHAERLYHLKEQYTSQVFLLEQVGILKEGEITGIDGNDYPIPTLEEIATRLFEQRETLKTKHDQGFTKLLLVPFGMSLDSLRETLKQFLFSYKQNNPSFDLDTNQPLWARGEYQGADIGDSPKLVYEVRSFEAKDHQGKTKMEILDEENNGGRVHGDGERKAWTVHLLQPSDPSNPDSPGFAPIPREGQGKVQGDLTPRPPFEADKTPKEYLSIFQEAHDDPNSPYFQESGMTPEDWIMAFMTHLEEIGRPLDEDQYTWLTGASFSSSIDVPSVGWRKDMRSVSLVCGDPRARYREMGTRSGIIV